jgi:hypothetical protein
MKARVWFEAQGRRMRSRGYNWPQAKVAIGLYSLPQWAQRAFARGHLLQSPPPVISDAAVAKAWDRFTNKLAALRAPAGVALPQGGQQK